MYEKFLALKEDKQKVILNAALEEFVKGGYDKASMNDLVEAAGISKGSLFYYFGNKKQLYLYLYSYCTSMIEALISDKEALRNPDVIQRLRYYIEASSAILESHPMVYEFLKAFKSEESLKVAKEIKEIIYSKSGGDLDLLLSDIDTTLFKEGVDYIKALDVIQITLEDIIHSHFIKGEDSMTGVLEKVYGYLDFFEATFYKEIR